MKITDASGGRLYANYDTIASANTAQLLAQGAESTTFTPTSPEKQVRYIMVTACDAAALLAKTAALIAATPDGSEDAAVYVPANCSGLVLPWSGKDVYFVNAVAGETPTVAVVGWY
jgi:hypothetical protein